MGKKLSFLFILLFLISIFGCSSPIRKPISKPIAIKETDPVKPYGKKIPTSPSVVGIKVMHKNLNIFPQPKTKTKNQPTNLNP